MADFSFHSDTDESSSVDQILSEAMDHIVLEQISAINCSSFSNSALPSHLESRFQRLKTFPSSKAQFKGMVPSKTTSQDCSKTPEKSGDLEGKDRSGYASSPSGSSDSSGIRAKSGDGKAEKTKLQSGKLQSGGAKVKNANLPSGSVSFRSNSSNSSSGYANPPKIRSKSADGNVNKAKSRTGSVSFRSNSSDSSVETVKSGCFWCSPNKKILRKKSASSRNLGVELGLDLGNDEELLSDLRSFSSKEQKKLMKKAIKEEEKIIKEAQKIVKWAKQSSSRLDFSASDDELTD